VYYSVTSNPTTRNMFKNNLNTGNQVQLGSIGKGSVPGEHWQTDFSELPRKAGYRYLSVLADTFSGWPEAFPL